MTDWIACSERLPHAETMVLVYGEGTCMVAKRRVLMAPVPPQWEAQASNDWVFGVTHWMPLPEPPK